AGGLGGGGGARGVAVRAGCPGATRTPGCLAARRGPVGRWSPPEAEPEDVVDEALAALGPGPSVIPGRTVRFGARLMQRVLTRVQAVRMMGRISRGLLTGAPPERT